MVAQGLGTRRRWIVPKTLDPKVSSAKAAAQAARIAWDRYVTDRGSQAIGDLIDAMELLLDQVPKGLSLTGNLLVKDGVQISRALTRKQAVFMQLLIDYDGKPVSDSDFRKQGIRRADLIKTRLLNDPNFGFLEYHSASENGIGYRLIP